MRSFLAISQPNACFILFHFHMKILGFALSYFTSNKLLQIKVLEKVKESVPCGAFWSFWNPWWRLYKMFTTFFWSKSPTKVFLYLKIPVAPRFTYPQLTVKNACRYMFSTKSLSASRMYSYFPINLIWFIFLNSEESYNGEVEGWREILCNLKKLFLGTVDWVQLSTKEILDFARKRSFSRIMKITQNKIFLRH